MRAYGSRLALLLLLPPPGSGERQQARFAYYSEALPLQARGPRLCEPLAHLDLEPPRRCARLCRWHARAAGSTLMRWRCAPHPHRSPPPPRVTTTQRLDASACATPRRSAHAAPQVDCYPARAGIDVVRELVQGNMDLGFASSVTFAYAVESQLGIVAHYTAWLSKALLGREGKTSTGGWIYTPADLNNRAVATVRGTSAAYNLEQVKEIFEVSTAEIPPRSRRDPAATPHPHLSRGRRLRTAECTKWSRRMRSSRCGPKG